MKYKSCFLLVAAWRLLNILTMSKSDAELSVVPTRRPMKSHRIPTTWSPSERLAAMAGLPTTHPSLARCLLQQSARAPSNYSTYNPAGPTVCQLYATKQLISDISFLCAQRIVNIVNGKVTQPVSAESWLFHRSLSILTLAGSGLNHNV